MAVCLYAGSPLQLRVSSRFSRDSLFSLVPPAQADYGLAGWHPGTCGYSTVQNEAANLRFILQLWHPERAGPCPQQAP